MDYHIQLSYATKIETIEFAIVLRAPSVKIIFLTGNLTSKLMNLADVSFIDGMHGWLGDTRDGYPNQYLVRDLDETPDFCNKMSVCSTTELYGFCSWYLVESSIP